MRKSLVRAALAVCLLGSAGLTAPTFSTAAPAASGPVVSKPVGVLLGAAQKLMAAGDLVTAKATVQQAQALPDKTPIDDYEINNFMGNISVKMNDHPTAEIAFGAMAESPVIPDADKAATFRIATLLATEAKHFDKAIKYGQAFVALKGPPDELVLTTMAQSYYYLNDYANAENFGNQAIAATPAGTVPRQTAYEVVFGSQVKERKDAEALKTLESLVTNFSDPGDWSQLIDASFASKGMKDIDALYFYRLRLATKATSSADDYSVYGTLALQIGYPAEAQAAFQAGIAEGKLSNSGKTAAQLADARARVAKDRATLPSFDATANKSPNGELDVKLAETYYGYGRYADSEAAARRGLGKGGAKTDANEANMLIGMSLAMQGKSADALTAFNNVKGGNLSVMRAAHLWSLYAGRRVTTATP
jgi:tetratricopeptide (TPR) repeat protein